MFTTSVLTAPLGHVCAIFDIFETFKCSILMTHDSVLPINVQTRPSTLSKLTSSWSLAQASSTHSLTSMSSLDRGRDLFPEPWWRVPGTACAVLTTSSTIPERIISIEDHPLVSLPVPVLLIVYSKQTNRYDHSLRVTDIHYKISLLLCC